MIPVLKHAFAIILAFILVFSTAMQGLAQGPAPSAGQPAFAPGEILVRFQPSVSPPGAQNSLRSEGMQPMEVATHDTFIRVQVEPGHEMEAIAELKARGDVEVAEPNYIAYALDTFPNDYGNQWGLSRINAPAAWDITTGGNNVTIAIVDTGIDLEHPDLNCPGKLLAGWDFVNNDNTPDDDNGHGSHVAGIAAACTNNGIGISGVAWGVQVLPVKVLDAGGNGYYSDVANGIIYATDAGAKIINLSLGGTGDSTVLKSAIQYAYDHGTLVVAAAGNFAQSGNPIFYPAAYATTLAVAATDMNDNWATFSEHYPYVAVAAPGVSIFSTWKNGTYATLSGTSMATPHVTGLAALIWSFIPSLTLAQVTDTIESTADDLGDAGKDDYFGYGRINAGRALKSLPALGLQTTSGQNISQGNLNFIVDNDSGPFPAADSIQVTTNVSNLITWTAIVSPDVSWLSITPGPPASGLTSAGSPGQFNLAASRPAAGTGIYTTTLVVTGHLDSGAIIGPVTSTVRIHYVPQLNRYRLPLIFKNASVP